MDQAYDRLRQDVIERALFRDVQLLFPVREIAALERVFYICAAETGSVMSVENLARAVKASPTTIDSFLRIIADTGLIVILKPYPGVSRRGLAGMPKVLLSDPALYRAAMQPVSPIIKPEVEGRLLETVIAQHILSLCRKSGGALSYWRKGDLEVDLVLELGSEVIPIGITRSRRVEKEDVAPLAAFLATHRKQSSTGLFLYHGVEKDISLEKGSGMVACRHIANYTTHLGDLVHL